MVSTDDERAFAVPLARLTYAYRHPPNHVRVDGEAYNVVDSSGAPGGAINYTSDAGGTLRGDSSSISYGTTALMSANPRNITTAT